MVWKKEKPLTSDELHIGCLTCSTACIEAPMNMIIAVGFGDAQVTKNNEVIYTEQGVKNEEDFWTVQDAENEALKDPDNDWRITKYGPFHGETFQRQGIGKWVCIESNKGFA